MLQRLTHARLPFVRLLRPSGLTVLSAVLLVLLPTLAVLQYRWVGQLSTAERERMQRNLANAAIQFRDSHRLLAQFDSDSGINWMWGDMGALQYWISHADLAARRFDRVIMTGEGH